MKHRKNGFWPKMAPLTKKDSTTLAKGSPKNKFTFSGVEAPAWQGARRANSRAI
jgi:hypothetical protein